MAALQKKNLYQTLDLKLTGGKRRDFANLIFFIFVKNYMVKQFSVIIKINGVGKVMKQLFFIFFAVLFSAALTSAQVNPDQAIQAAQDRFTDIKNRSMELERIKRDTDRPIVSNDSTIEFPKIKEDFEQIQKINSDILQQAVVKLPINYPQVLKAASEINHRAARLKSNLFALALKDKKQARSKEEIVSEPQDIKVLFSILDNSINDFVHNSIFQNINVVNQQDSLKAENDLETIIKISSLLKEKAKKSAE